MDTSANTRSWFTMQMKNINESEGQNIEGHTVQGPTIAKQNKNIQKDFTGHEFNKNLHFHWLTDLPFCRACLGQIFSPE